MDARDRLRQYLEQRKEMGEQDLVLDGLSVEDLMKIVGAPVMPGAMQPMAARPPAKVSRPEPPPIERPAPPPIERPAPPSAAAAKVVVPSGPIDVGGSVSEGARAASHLVTLDAVANAIAAC